VAQEVPRSRQEKKKEEKRRMALWMFSRPSSRRGKKELSTFENSYYLGKEGRKRLSFLGKGERSFKMAFSGGKGKHSAG